MFKEHNRELCEILKNSCTISSDQLSDLRESQLVTGKTIATLAIDSGYITKENLLRDIANHLQWEYLENLPTEIPDDLLSVIPVEAARAYAIVPVKADSASVDLVAKDPFNSHIVEELTFSLNKEIRLIVSAPDDVEKLFLSSYGEDKITVNELLDKINSDYQEKINDDELSDTELNAKANDAPIVKFVNLILTQAIKDEASDIHFEPFDNQFQIRYRIDGALYEMTPPPVNLAIPVISRIKVLANLNIAERRIPQDGRINITIAGRLVDLRVSTLPTQFGESVVLRVLDKSVVNLDIEQLGMPEEVLTYVKKVANRPNGIFIVTGPTGSGKTTTLYSALKNVNREEIKILTIEDPVEYEIDGIMQVGINNQSGLDFSRALRAFLRQDPDKILVGEIRDLETARIAVQASLTGHLVMSTLHTNDAPGAITRLIDMGLEPYLISASLESVLSQRLVRKICPSCKQTYKPTEKIIEQLGMSAKIIGDKNFLFGSGCTKCNKTGYKGRIGLYELLKITDSLRNIITQSGETLYLKQKAVEEGMVSLRNNGIQAILDGVTTSEEVLKYT